MTDDTPPRMFKSPEGEARFLAAYDTVLRDWPVPYEERDIPTRFGSTHVIASGPPDAPPVVLLHSLSASATVWRANVKPLSERHRVYAVDVIGQPGKSIPSRMLRDRDDYAAWLGDVLDGLGVMRATLIGSSFGAFLSMNQAIKAPQRVEKLVLIGPAGTFAGLPLRFYYTMLVRGPLLRLLRGRKPEVPAALPAGIMLNPGDEAWGALMRIVMMDSARPITIMASVFSRAEMRGVRAPALLLVGEKEVLYDAHALVKRAMVRMPGLRAAVVKGAHHIAAQSKPDDVNARILQFLGG